jgi:hypothetical protein
MIPHIQLTPFRVNDDHYLFQYKDLASQVNSRA